MPLREFQHQARHPRLRRLFAFAALRKAGFVSVTAILLSSALLARADAPSASPPAAASFASAASVPKTDEEALALFQRALDEVRKQYVAEYDQKTLVTAALKGLMAALDGHSAYITPSEYADFQENAQGEFGGVGLVVAVENGAVKVISPVDGAPAAHAGIESGSTITEIEGVSTAGYTLKQVVKKLRGEAGTSVKVTILTPQKEARRVELVREMIRNQTVYFRLIGDIGWIRISGFGQGTVKEFGEAIEKLTRQAPKMKGLVLDLRNNGGGFFDAAIEVASRFLSPGDIVVKSGRSAAETKAWNVRPPADLLHGVPIVVLINGGSASAAEIVAGALQDKHRARVVGMTSWGKGLVQTIIPLHDGADGALSVTTARYYTPSGRSIQKMGVVPDLQVARDATEVNVAMEAGESSSEATLANALDNESHAVRQKPQNVEIPGNPARAKGTEGATAEDGTNDTAKAPQKPLPPLFAHTLVTDDDIAQDFQLQRALDVLAFGGADTARVKKPARIYKAP
jgi:carboxyl-terminal processing protease